MPRFMFAGLCATALLAGCSYNVENPVDYVTYRNEPLVEQVKEGMTKEQAVTLGGPPSTETIQRGEAGSCNNYVLNHEGKQQPYYVYFDRNDRVISKGFMTCEEHEINERKKARL